VASDSRPPRISVVLDAGTDLPGPPSNGGDPIASLHAPSSFVPSERGGSRRPGKHPPGPGCSVARRCNVSSSRPSFPHLVHNRPTLASSSTIESAYLLLGGGLMDEVRMGQLGLVHLHEV